MTLGDLISNYLAAGNTMADFSRDSGLSRAYAYLLIKNKSNGGGKITPSIDTVKKYQKEYISRLMQLFRCLMMIW